MFESTLLTSFLAVEQAGGFSAAARQLGLRQSTVSGHIARLEHEVGKELFVRDTHTVLLTSDGAAMVGFARDILRAHDAAHRYFGGGALTGRVRFGASEDLVAQELPAILLEFRRAHPQIELELSVGLSEEVHASLRANRLDLAFVKRRRGESHGQLIFADEMVWAGAQDMSVDLSRPVPIVTYRPPSITRDAAVSVLERAGIEYRVACLTQGQLGLRAAALAGLGFFVHSKSLLGPGLRPVTGLPHPGTVEFVLVSRPRRLSAPERALVQLIVENADRLRPDPG